MHTPHVRDYHLDKTLTTEITDYGDYRIQTRGLFNQPSLPVTVLSPLEIPIQNSTRVSNYHLFLGNYTYPRKYEAHCCRR